MTNGSSAGELTVDKFVDDQTVKEVIHYVVSGYGVSYW